MVVGGGGVKKSERMREEGNQKGSGLHFAFWCVPDTILSANQKQVGGEYSKCAKTKNYPIFPRYFPEHSIKTNT